MEEVIIVKAFWPIVIPLLAIAGGVVSSLINKSSQTQSIEQQNRANMELAQYQFEQNKQMWNMQNQYNAPYAQMQRLVQAGLNPNMVYGSGSVTGNQSGSAPSFDRPEMHSTYAPLNLPNIQNIINQYQDFRMRQAQTDNVQAQTEATQARTAVDNLRARLLGFDILRGEANAPYFAEVAKSSAGRAKALYEKELQAIKNMSIDEQNKVLQNQYKRGALKIQDIQKEAAEADLLWKQYRNELRDYGLTDHDNVFFRIIIRQLMDMGVDPRSWIETLVNRSRRSRDLLSW